MHPTLDFKIPYLIADCMLILSVDAKTTDKTFRYGIEEREREKQISQLQETNRDAISKARARV
jgi:hypothetical protein